MAIGVVPNVGEFTLLEIYRDRWMNVNNPKMHLFKNDHVPGPEDLLSDYTECDFSGYSPDVLDEWDAPVLQADGSYMIQEVNNSIFANAGGPPANDIYGYYVTDNSSSVLLWAQRDPNAPFRSSTLNHIYIVRARFFLQSRSDLP